MSASPAPSEIEAALAEHGFAAMRIELISPLRERKGVRLAYRVESADGRLLKARLCGSDDEARGLVEARASLEAAFAPVVACYGAVLLEEWIEGEPLDDAGAEARAEEAGGLLGRLHALALPPSTEAVASTEPWRRAASADIELLAGANVLDARQAEALCRRLASEAPRQTRRSLVHRDFCAENMLVDGGGRLRLIDNERVGVDASGFDLGWTFHRWPMSAAAWSRFLRGYRSAAEDPGDVTFWQIAAALTATRVFFQRMPERLADSRERLRRFCPPGAESE